MSVQRRCDYTLASDGQWYLTLGDFEHAHDDRDRTVYGPFNSKEALDKWRCANHSNPGGMNTYEDDTMPVPKNVVSPGIFR